MKKCLTSTMCVVLFACSAVTGAEGLKFADILTDNMVFQRGKDIRVWGTAPAGSKVNVLLTQSRDEAVTFAGEKALARDVPETKPDKTPPPSHGKVKLGYVVEGAVPVKTVSRTVTAGEDGMWEALLGVHEASFTPIYVAAKSGESKIAIQNIVIGELWIASGQSNMEWAHCRANMWEKNGLLFNAVRYAKVRGASTAPRESFVDASAVKKGRAFEPWIVCEDGAVNGVSAIAYLFS